MSPKTLLSTLTFSLLLVAQASNAAEMQIDFSVKFSQSYDFATSTWASIDRSTTATVTLDMDAPRFSYPQYWGAEIQAITTYFGRPSVSSPFFDTMPQRPAGGVWQEIDHSSAIVSNIDYSISWPETFFGRGPKVSYQFTDNQTWQKGTLYWQEITGFNLATPLSVGDIAPRTPADFVSYVNAAYAANSTFSTGFNAFLSDLSTGQNLSGVSYQGTAVIRDVRLSSAVPEPQTLLLAMLGLAGMATARRKSFR